MGEENVEIGRRVFDAVVRGDSSTVSEAYDRPDQVFRAFRDPAKPLEAMGLED